MFLQRSHGWNYNQKNVEEEEKIPTITLSKKKKGKARKQKGYYIWQWLESCYDLNTEHITSHLKIYLYSLDPVHFSISKSNLWHIIYLTKPDPRWSKKISYKSIGLWSHEFWTKLIAKPYKVKHITRYVFPSQISVYNSPSPMKKHWLNNNLLHKSVVGYEIMHCELS